MALETEGLSEAEIELLKEHEEEMSSEGDDDGGEESGDTVKAPEGEDTVKGAADVVPAEKPAIRLEADDSQAKAELDALTAKRADLRKQYNEGDIDRDEYDAQMDALADRIADAKAEVNKAAIYREITEKTYRQQWNDAVDSFLEDKSNAPFRADGPLHLALDAKIREMNKSEESLAKFPNHAARLNEAKRIVLEAARKALGVESPQRQPVGNNGKRPNVELPPSLDDIPPSADDRESEFAHIDRLSPEHRERAIAKMSPEQYDRYLSGT